MNDPKTPIPDEEPIIRTLAPDDLDSPRNPENDPVSDLPEIDTTSANAPQLGKLVFTPSELNNAGEDKDYFHPKNDHQFSVPADANENALTPDIELTPDNTVKPLTSGS